MNRLWRANRMMGAPRIFGTPDLNTSVRSTWCIDRSAGTSGGPINQENQTKKIDREGDTPMETKPK